MDETNALVTGAGMTIIDQERYGAALFTRAEKR
jgi:hypothetical protein